MMLSVRQRREIASRNASRQGRNSFWTEERLAMLRGHWRAGAFAAEIATVIGDGCTKAMVLSKAKRIGLDSRSPTEFSKKHNLHCVLRETSGGRA